MAYDGTLTFDVALDTAQLEAALAQLGDIVNGSTASMQALQIATDGCAAAMQKTSSVDSMSASLKMANSVIDGYQKKAMENIITNSQLGKSFGDAKNSAGGFAQYGLSVATSEMMGFVGKIGQATGTTDLLTGAVKAMSVAYAATQSVFGLFNKEVDSQIKKLAAKGAIDAKDISTLTAKQVITGVLTGQIDKQTAAEALSIKKKNQAAAASLAQTAGATANAAAKGADTAATVANTAAESTNTAATQIGIGAKIKEAAISAAASIKVALHTVSLIAHAVASKAAAVASTLFGVAVNSSMIVLVAIIAVIALVVAAIVALVGWLTKSSEGYAEQKAEVEELTKAQEELAAQSSKNATEYELATTRIEAQSKVVEGLTNKLREWENVAGTSADKTKGMNDALAQINATIDGLNLVYDENTDSIWDMNNAQKVTADTIDDIVDAKTAFAKTNSMQERANKLVEEQAQISEELALIEIKRQKIEKDSSLHWWERDKLLNELTETENGYREQLEDNGDRIKIVNGQIETSNQEMADGCMDGYDSMDQRITDSGVTIEELAMKYGLSTDEIKKQLDAQKISLTDWNQNNEDALAAVQERTSGVVNSFKEIPAQYEMTAAEMLAVLQSNKERYAQWEANMEEITKKLGPTAAAEFEKLGPAANSAMEEILASEDSLEAFQKVFGVTMDATTGKVIEDFNNPDFIGAPSAGITQAAANVSQNNDLTGAVDGVVEEAGKNADTTGATAGIGENIVAGAAESTENADPAPLTTGIEGATETAAANGDYTTAGQNVADGLATAVKSATTEELTAGLKNSVEKAIDDVEFENSANKILKEISDSVKDDEEYKIADKIKTNLKDGLKKADFTDAAGTLLGELGTSIADSKKTESLEEAIKPIVKTALESIEYTEAGQNIIDGITANLVAGVDIEALKESFAATVKQAIEGADYTEAASGTVGQFNTALQESFNASAETLDTSGMVGALTSSLQGNSEAVTGAATNVAGQFTGSLQTAFDSAEVNVSLAGMTSSMVASLQNEESKLLLGEAAQGLTDTIQEPFTALAEDMATTTAEILDAITTPLGEDVTVSDSMTALIEDAKTDTATQVTTSNFSEIGKQMTEGIKKGVTDNKSSMIKAIVDAAVEAYNAAKSALDINSPSRLFRDGIGMQTMEGWAKGLHDGSGSVLDEITNTALASSRTAEKAMKKMHLQGGVVQMLGRLQGGLMANQARLATANGAPVFAGNAAASSGHTEVYLEQNITSPKALSPAEITQEGIAFVGQVKWKLP